MKFTTALLLLFTTLSCAAPNIPAEVDARDAAAQPDYNQQGHNWRCNRDGQACFRPDDCCSGRCYRDSWRFARGKCEPVPTTRQTTTTTKATTQSTTKTTTAGVSTCPSPLTTRVLVEYTSTWKSRGRTYLSLATSTSTRTVTYPCYSFPTTTSSSSNTRNPTVGPITTTNSGCFPSYSTTIITTYYEITTRGTISRIPVTTTAVAVFDPPCAFPSSPPSSSSSLTTPPLTTPLSTSTTVPTRSSSVVEYCHFTTSVENYYYTPYPPSPCTSSGAAGCPTFVIRTSYIYTCTPASTPRAEPASTSCYYSTSTGTRTYTIYASTPLGYTFSPVGLTTSPYTDTLYICSTIRNSVDPVTSTSPRPSTSPPSTLTRCFYSTFPVTRTYSVSSLQTFLPSNSKFPAYITTHIPTTYIDSSEVYTCTPYSTIYDTAIPVPTTSTTSTTSTYPSNSNTPSTTFSTSSPFTPSSAPLSSITTSTSSYYVSGSPILTSSSPTVTSGPSTSTATKSPCTPEISYITSAYLTTIVTMGSTVTTTAVSTGTIYYDPACAFYPFTK